MIETNGNQPTEDKVPAAIAQFRDVARQWEVPPAPAIAFVTRPRSNGARWVLATAAVMLMAAVPLYRGMVHEVPVAANPVADGELLSQVDAQLGRGIPAPMEPLLNLVAWNAVDLTNSQRNAK